MYPQKYWSTIFCATFSLSLTPLLHMCACVGTHEHAHTHFPFLYVSKSHVMSCRHHNITLKKSEECLLRNRACSDSTISTPRGVCFVGRMLHNIKCKFRCLFVPPIYTFTPSFFLNPGTNCVPCIIFSFYPYSPLNSPYILLLSLVTLAILKGPGQLSGRMPHKEDFHCFLIRVNIQQE